MDVTGVEIPDERLSAVIIAAAIEVHRHLGPGLLESAYEACLAREFDLRNIPYERQVPLPIFFKDLRLDCGYRLGFLVADEVIVEVKSIEKIAPVHQAQALTYLRFIGKRLCLILNFNEPLLKDGIRRVIL